MDMFDPLTLDTVTMTQYLPFLKTRLISLIVALMSSRWAKNRNYTYYYAAHGFGVEEGGVKRTWCYLGTDPSVYPVSHKAAKCMLKDIGEMMGKTVYQELKEGPYRYDVVWKDSDSKDMSPSHVFEIQDKGNLDSALAKLQHAKDKWPAKLFIVVAREKDRSRLDKMLEPYWLGTFHMLRGRVMAMTADEVRKVHKCFTSHKATIKAFMEPF